MIAEPAAIRPRIDSRWRLYQSAREGFGALLDVAGIGRDRGAIALPAYIGWSSREGSGVYDPVRARQIDARFYRLHANLTVDVDDFRKIVEGLPEPAVALVIHYFGRPDPHLGELARLARTRRALLVEDAAHAFFSGKVAGSCGMWGDAVLYSVPKMFDVTSGGILELNTASLQSAIPAGVAGQLDAPDWLAALGEDFSAHAAARLRHYEQLVRGLAELAPAVMPLWPQLPDGTVPQTLPVRVLTTVLRDRLYFGLKREGFVVASLYHTLIEELPRSQYPSAFELAGVIFNLPVAADLDDREVIRLTHCLAALVTEAA